MVIGGRDELTLAPAMRFTWGRSSVAEQVTVNHRVGGSKPLAPAKPQSPCPSEHG